MGAANPVINSEVQAWSDEEVVGRVLAGETALFEILMRRHNQRIYRIVRGMLDNEAKRKTSCRMRTFARTNIGGSSRAARHS